MSIKLFLFLFVFILQAPPSLPQSNDKPILTDSRMQYIINTLPRLVPQLREEGIIISQAYYIWPKDAALHAKGEVILEQYGYDAIKLEALEMFCKAWFCENYDSLLPERRKILHSVEEQMTENPYLTDNQKRINIRITNKELGHDHQTLRENIGEENLRQIRVYRNKIEEIWKELNED